MFCLVHLDDGDEAMVIVPGGEKVAMGVPLEALPDFLPLLHEATKDLGAACCDGCGEALPGKKS